MTNYSLYLVCFNHFYHTDHANAAIHLADVKYSPITFRLAETLENTSWETDEVYKVLMAKGKYELDHGR